MPVTAMRSAFAAWPEAVAATSRIAERCRFDIVTQLGYQFPDYPTPNGESSDDYLRSICGDEMRRRYGGVRGQVSSKPHGL